jgi:hypothetical protein
MSAGRGQDQVGISHQLGRDPPGGEAVRLVALPLHDRIGQRPDRLPGHSRDTGAAVGYVSPRIRFIINSAMGEWIRLAVHTRKIPPIQQVLPGATTPHPDVPHNVTQMRGGDPGHTPQIRGLLIREPA